MRPRLGAASRSGFWSSRDLWLWWSEFNEACRYWSTCHTGGDWKSWGYLAWRKARPLRGYLISVYKYQMAEDTEEKARLSWLFCCLGRDKIKNSTISLTMQWNRFPVMLGSLLWKTLNINWRKSWRAWANREVSSCYDEVSTIHVSLPASISLLLWLFKSVGTVLVFSH